MLEASSGTKNLLILAGEDSGDLHGAELTRALVKHPGVRVYAFGGKRMQKAGAHLLKNTLDTAVLGITEVFAALPRLLRLQQRIRQWVVQNLPAAVILIDYPGFHLRQLSYLSGLVPVFYYIPPKVWVWRAGRAKLLARYCRRIYPIFPFEKRFYPEQKTRYFGHPLLDITKPPMGREEFRALLSIRDDEKVIGLLPGSRRMEVKVMLPEFLKAAEVLASRFKKLRFVVARTSGLDKSLYQAVESGKLKMSVVEDQSLNLMDASHLILATSGTVTLEAAILKTPMLICNKVNALTRFAFDRLSHVQWVGLPNLIAGREICPEFLQEKMKAEDLAAQASRMLEDTLLWQHQREELSKVVSRLGEPGVVARIAGDMVGSL